MGHELLRLLVDRLGVDQDLADVRVVVVADRADDEARLLVDQVGARLQLRRVLDRTPQLHQVVQVPLQLFGGAADAGGPRDDAHAVGHVELRDRVAQLVAVLALDAARDAAAARVVGHQHEVAAGERDVGRERGALVAALVLVDLDDQLHAFADLVLDATAAAFAVLVVAALAAALQELAGDLLERQEAVAVGAVVDEAGLERLLDARHDGLVDVGLPLLLRGGLDVEVDQLLAVDDGHPELFGLGGVEQHALHADSFVRDRRRPARKAAGTSRRGAGRLGPAFPVRTVRLRTGWRTARAESRGCVERRRRQGSSHRLRRQQALSCLRGGPFGWCVSPVVRLDGGSRGGPRGRGMRRTGRRTALA